MRIKEFSNIDFIHPAPFAEITLACTYKELKDLLLELEGVPEQQVEIIVRRKDMEGI